MENSHFYYTAYKPTRRQLKTIKEVGGDNCVLRSEQNLLARTFHDEHTREVEVRTSTIRGGKWGVYTIKEIKPYQLLSTYDGELVTLDEKERKAWLNDKHKRSHLKTLDGSLSNGTIVIDGLREDIAGRGVASLVNDPANNFAFANTTLFTNKVKGVVYLKSTQKIKKGRELFYHYDRKFKFPFKRVVRLTRKEVKENIHNLSTYLNKKRIKTPNWEEMTKKALTDTKRKWTAPLANYALIREDFIAPKEITCEALKLLKPDTEIYKELLSHYIRNIPHKNDSLLITHLTDEAILPPGEGQSTLWTPSDFTDLNLKSDEDDETTLPPPQDFQHSYIRFVNRLLNKNDI